MNPISCSFVILVKGNIQLNVSQNHNTVMMHPYNIKTRLLFATDEWYSFFTSHNKNTYNCIHSIVKRTAAKPSPQMTQNKS